MLMGSVFRQSLRFIGLLSFAALLVPSAVEAREPSGFLVDETVEFDFTPLVLGDFAQASAGSQEPEGILLLQGPYPLIQVQVRQ